jgi:hypothetical protein
MGGGTGFSSGAPHPMRDEIRANAATIVNQRFIDEILLCQTARYGCAVRQGDWNRHQDGDRLT